MKKQYEDFLAGLHSRYDGGGYVVGSGCGSGLSAKGAVAGGADFLACYSTAVYRTRGLPTLLSFLPYDDCNKITQEAFPNVKVGSGDRPVLIGCGAHDLRWTVDGLIDKAEELGADGTVNEFFIGYFRGHSLKKAVDDAGMGFSRELELVRKTLDRGLLSLTWVFDEQEAAAAASLGAPLIGLMLYPENCGMKDPDDYDSVVAFAIKMAEAAFKENPDAILFLHGGAAEKYENVRYILQRTPVQGFFTGSSGERIPVVPAIADTVRNFREIPFVPYRK